MSFVVADGANCTWIPSRFRWRFVRSNRPSRTVELHHEPAATSECAEHGSCCSMTYGLNHHQYNEQSGESRHLETPLECVTSRNILVAERIAHGSAARLPASLAIQVDCDGPGIRHSWAIAPACRAPVARRHGMPVIGRSRSDRGTRNGGINDHARNHSGCSDWDGVSHAQSGSGAAQVVRQACGRRCD